MPLDPLRLNPSASLNRLRIMNIPGIEVDPEVRGKTGYELVSTQYITTQILKSADQLRLTAEEISGEQRQIPILLNRCLDSDDMNVRSAAMGIARSFGRNLAYLLVTLKRGDLVNREARPDWDSSYWDYWATIRKIWLGGGLLSGEMGTLVLAAMHELFAEIPNEVYAVEIEPHGVLLPLIGAATSAPGGTTGAVVLDFGGSFVKRAYAVYEDDVLVELHTLPQLPAPRDASADEDESAAYVIESMMTAFLDSLHSVFAKDLVVSRIIPTSIASYIDGGQVADRQGGKYTLLRQITDNASRFFTAAVSAKLGVPVEITLLHDGSAAAAAYAGEPDTAVIMLGTALGVGFAPPSEQRRGVRHPVDISNFGSRS